jgi:hypothetical protein
MQIIRKCAMISMILLSVNAYGAEEIIKENSTERGVIETEIMNQPIRLSCFTPMILLDIATTLREILNELKRSN